MLIGEGLKQVHIHHHESEPCKTYLAGDLATPAVPIVLRTRHTLATRISIPCFVFPLAGPKPQRSQVARFQTS
jgi:hypothetical protein